MWSVGNSSPKKLHNGTIMATFIPTDFAREVTVLLDLADDPQHDVKTTTEFGPLAVVVPDELLLRFHVYQSLTPSSPPKEPKKKGSKS